MSVTSTAESARSQARTLALATLQALNQGFESSSAHHVNTILPMLYSSAVHVVVEDHYGQRVQSSSLRAAFRSFTDFQLLSARFVDTKVLAFHYVPTSMTVFVSGSVAIHPALHRLYSRVLTITWGVHRTPAAATQPTGTSDGHGGSECSEHGDGRNEIQIASDRDMDSDSSESESESESDSDSESDSESDSGMENGMGEDEDEDGHTKSKGDGERDGGQRCMGSESGHESMGDVCDWKISQDVITLLN